MSNSVEPLTAENKKLINDFNKLMGTYLEVASAKQVLTNKICEEDLKPLYNWLVKLKALGKLNFKLSVSYNSRGLYILVSDCNMEINIPKDIKNIRVSVATFSQKRFKMNLLNVDSLTINTGSYYETLNLTLNNRIEVIPSNIELYKRIEKVAIKLIEAYENSGTEEERDKEAKKLDDISIDRLITLIWRHNIEIGKPLTEEIMQKLKKNIEIIRHYLNEVVHGVSNYKKLKKTVAQQLKQLIHNLEEEN